MLIEWEATNYTKDTLTLQLYFDDSFMVSANKKKDKLFIVFIENGIFKTADEFKVIKYNYTTSETIPIQEPDFGTIESLGFIMEQQQIVFNTVVASNFFLNFFLSASLQQLWTLINSLQIIVFMPLIEV